MSEGRFAPAALRLAGLAGWHLRWNADRFWNATPAEMETVVRAMLGDGGAEGAGDTTPAQATEDVLGQAVLPLAPVHATARPESGGWRFDWIRRSRAGWSWSDGADAPLAEEQELYRIDLIHGGVVFRSATVASPQWSYDAASIAADLTIGMGGAVTVEVRQIGTHGPGRPAFLSITI